MVKFHFQKKFILTIGLLWIWMTSASAQDEIYLKIQTEVFKQIDLIVRQFNSEFHTDLTDEVRNIIINDLKLTNYFRILGPEDSLNISRLNRNLQAQAVAAQLEADLEIKSNSIMLSCFLSDLQGKNSIFKKKYQSSFQSMRWLAHQVADDVVYYLTGETGIISTQIAFVTTKNKAKEIAVIDYDGYGFKLLTSNKSLNLSPRWAPDGKRIAFTSYLAGNPDLMILSLNDKKTVRFSSYQGLNTAPSWSPDGKKIALTLARDGNPEIYTIEVNSGKLQRLTNHLAIDSSPSWSPDCREIVFTSDRSGSPQIYIMAAEGGNTRRLTFSGSYNDSPAWSPKGDRIAFVSRNENQFHIYTIDVNGENQMCLTDGSGNNENPSWSPDGLRIVFASNRDDKWNIYIMYWNGSQLRRLTTNGGNVSPSWSSQLKYN